MSYWNVTLDVIMVYILIHQIIQQRATATLMNNNRVLKVRNILLIQLTWDQTGTKLSSISNYQTVPVET
jgi:hypothetical protein